MRSSCLINIHAVFYDVTDEHRMVEDHDRKCDLDVANKT